MREQVKWNNVTVSRTPNHWTQDYCFQSKKYDPQKMAGAFCESKQRAYILSLSIFELHRTPECESNALWLQFWSPYTTSLCEMQARAPHLLLRQQGIGRCCVTCDLLPQLVVETLFPSFSFLVNECLKCLNRENGQNVSTKHACSYLNLLDEHLVQSLKGQNTHLWWASVYCLICPHVIPKLSFVRAAVGKSTVTTQRKLNWSSVRPVPIVFCVI